MWAEANGTTVAGGASISAPTATSEGSSRGGASLGAETRLSATISSASGQRTPEQVSTTRSGASFGLSQSSSGAAQQSTAGAQPMQSLQAGAGLAGLLGVVAYALV